MLDDLVRQSRQDIKKGSKSFALASFFFSQKEKEAAWKLYSWCRYCDDVIDHALTLSDAQSNVDGLIRDTHACYAGSPPAHHPWPAFSQVIHDYKIPQKYPLDLIRGFQIDASGSKIADRHSLLDYCYCVAGTVGLMMCHIMGVNSEAALNHAVDLGRAMQLTNVSRDINEDFLIGRIYLPSTWLKEFGLNATNFLDLQKTAQLKEVVQKLISEARRCYASGELGLRYLPLRSAWAVSIALHVYRDIGEQVIKNVNFQNRVIVSGWKKIYLLARASFSLIPLILYRINNPWKPTKTISHWSES